VPSSARGRPGKSTLLNRLTAAGVLAEDKLFATLDPTTRRLTLPSGKEVLLTDTVGFIQVGAGRRLTRSPLHLVGTLRCNCDNFLGGAQKLPTQLIAAFQATLEEIESSTLLMHIVDVSHPNAAAQSASVLSVRSCVRAHGRVRVCGHMCLLRALSIGKWAACRCCQSSTRITCRWCG